MTENTAIQVDGHPMRPVYTEVKRGRRLDPVELRSVEPSVREQVGMTKAGEGVVVTLSPT